MKARVAPAGRQPAVTTSTGVRGTAPDERRQNIAGAPYYRGLHWDC